MFILYLATNQINSKQYVGITSRTLQKRMMEHKSKARLGSEEPFHRAIRKYGFASFSVETLATAETWEEVCQLEIEAIAQRKTNQSAFGYNATDGGEGTLGISRDYLRGDNNPSRRPGGTDHMRGDRSWMRLPEYRERMRGDANPARKPGVMDCVKGEANPAKRLDVREKISERHALNNSSRRADVIAKISASCRGKKKPQMAGKLNPRCRPESRAALTGKGNPNAKTVMIAGVIYGTLQEAANALGVAQAATIKARILRGVPGYSFVDDATGTSPQTEQGISITSEANPVWRSGGAGQESPAEGCRDSLGD